LPHSIGTIRDGMNTDNQPDGRSRSRGGLSAFSLSVSLAFLLVGCSRSSSDEPLRVTTMQAAMAAPDQVEELDLYYRRLSSFPPEILQLRNLKRLTLRTCRIGELPATIVSLTGLTTLDMGETSLTHLTPGVGSLTNLSRLWLNDNALASLPGELGSLQHLEYLNCDRNQLSRLPEQTGSLRALKWLRLNNNQLHAMPDDLSGLAQNLKTLYLMGNPIPDEERTRIRKALPNCTVYFDGAR
jgi:Leucine-rich repeat (LRR) protein